MRKSWEKDSRINAKGVTFWETIGIFIGMCAFNGFHMWIFTAIQLRWPDISTNAGIYINLLGGYVLFVALVMTLFTAFMRHYSLGRPMQRIGDAARQIAQGDFSARVASMRKDGKKDHVEILIDDFNKMAEELGSIESMKNDFISNVSHEIKTPLAVIQNYGAALQKDALSPEQRKEYSATIVSASQKLSTLVTNILKLNKLENQEIVPTATFLDLGEQLRQCALSFEDLWDKKDILFTADIQDGVIVNCDESMLEIVWNNLLSNAIKFTNPGGEITVTMKEEDGFAITTVSDSGCGMNETTGRHIFDKFYQGDTSHSQEGNGLGLALVKRVIDLSEGSIKVDSRIGEGTTFTVRLKTEV